MNVIGLKCRYAGDDGSLRARRLVVAGVIRGARGAAPGRLHVETDDSEFEDWPVTADDVVRVRVEGGRETSDVRAVDLDVFRHLSPPRMMKLDVQLEEGNAQALMWAARAMRRPLDAVINDAVAAHVRALGVGRSAAKTLIGVAPGH
ncbi:MAG: hypothetical protein ACLQVI_03530 [Polyangiaceae bacterium]